ncbi:MAG TPA: hypothetical protein VF043_15625 [Ktedonobacteraceae bacterium]
MDTLLLNARPGRQHPTCAATMSLPHARSWPLPCSCQQQRQKASNRRQKKYRSK